LSKSRRTLSRVEPKTGKIKWSTTLESRRELEASPLAADGKIYLLNFDGEAAVVNSEDGKILSVIPMEQKEDLGSELIRSSIIATNANSAMRKDSSS